MRQPIRILYLEDDPTDVKLVQSTIQSAGMSFRISAVQTQGEFEVALRREEFDVVLADYCLRGYDGLSALRLAGEIQPDLPFIFVSGTMGEDAAIEGFTGGARDYVSKSKLSRLPPAISRAIRDAENHRGRRRAEAEKEQFYKFFRTSVDLMVIADSNGVIKKTNPACTETLGYSEAELKARAFVDFIHPEDKQPTLNELARLQQMGFSLSFENRIMCKDGTCRWLSWRAIFNKEEGIAYATARDVTERKKVEEELRKAKEKAEVASRVKSAFLATMSHEIRTPMNAILGFTDLVLETPLKDNQREYLEIVRARGKDLLTLINDILDLSRIEAEKLEISPILFNLSHVVNEISRMFLLDTTKKNLDLSVSIDKAIPLGIYGDLSRVRQILVNLMGNAVKFTPKGRIALEVLLEGAPEENEKSFFIHFRVRDTGIGISEEKQKILFAPFCQGDSSSTREYGGSGLGLAISKRLAELMGGRIWVESKQFEGSVFHVLLPFSEGPFPASRSSSQPSMVVRKKGYRILMVEDDPSSRNLVELFLQKGGHTCISVGTGTLAIRELSTKDFDLVLMDVMLPGMDGFETSREIRNPQSPVRNHQIPIIALTAHAMVGDNIRCQDSGMNAYVSKPVSAEVLLGTLQRTMEGLETGQIIP